MLVNEIKRRGRSEPDIAREFGWSQQAFNTWKAGTVPRAQFHERLASFLGITVDQMSELAEEAKTSPGSNKLPDIGAPVKGRGTAAALTLDRFASGYALPSVTGTYAVRVDGRHTWINPQMRPVDGNTVLIRTDNEGRIATWPVELAEGEEAHVVVLAEMI